MASFQPIQPESDFAKNQCKICLKVFKAMGTLKFHYKKIHNNYLCDYCNKLFSANDCLSQHIENDHKFQPKKPVDSTNKIFSCIISRRCKKTFKSDHDLENHVLLDHCSRQDINELILAKYQSEFDRLKTFKAWTIVCISPERLANSGFIYTGREDNVQCVFCAGTIVNWEEKLDPIVEHKINFPNCSFILNNDNVGNIPMRDPEILDKDDQEKSNLQAMVDKLLSEKQALQKEMAEIEELKVENQNLKSENNYLVRQLDNKQTEFEKLQVENKKLKSVIAKKKTPKTTKVPKKCEICGKSFNLKQNFNRHLKRHENDQKCEFCEKSFSNVKDLKKHILVVHEGKKGGLGCEECGKVFPKKSNLILHIKTVHEKQRNFICQVCNKGFGIQANLDRHSAVHKK